MIYPKGNRNNLLASNEVAHFNMSTLPNMVITPKVVEEKHRMLNCNKSQGPGGIPARVLKELALLLSILFNKSIESRVLPLQLKIAIATLFLKKEHIVTKTITNQLVLHIFNAKYWSQLSWVSL